MQCIVYQKRAKTRFFPELSLVFFKSKPKMQFKHAKIKKILWPDFEKLAETLIFGQKWPFLDHFYPLKEAKIDSQNFFCKKVKLRAHTLLKSHHTSKLDHFWARYLQKMVKNPYYVTTCNVFLTKKGAKTAKTRFFPELSLVFFKSKPEIQFKYAKLRRSYDWISKN